MVSSGWHVGIYSRSELSINKGLRPLFLSGWLMKKLFLLLCMTAAVLIAGRAHAATLYTVVNINGSVQGCSNPAIGQVIDPTVFGECAIGKIWGGGTKAVSQYRVYGGRLSVYLSGATSWYSWIPITAAASCPEGYELNTETGICEPPPPTRCEILRDRGEVVHMNWNQAAYGSQMTGSYYCSSYGCASQISGTTTCLNGTCYSDANLTGDECDGSGNSSICTDETCSSPKPPNEPDPDQPTPEPGDENPVHDPDDPTSPVDSGGNVANPDIDPSTPDPVDPAPEVTPPETGEATDAIVNMNRDVNKALNDLNIDINSSNTKIENELKLLNASNEGIKSQLTQLEETTIKIGDNNKALITQLNRDVTTAVNVNTNAINKLGGKVDSLNNTVGDLKESVDGMATDVGDIKESVSGMGETLDGMADDLSGIGDAIDGLANIDGEGLRQGTCFSNPQYTFCKGWYEPNYPDGFRGVFDEQFGQLTESVTSSVSNIFGNLDLSNASAPNFCLSFWMLGNVCFTDYIDFSWLFGFVRFAMMFSTVWLCRSLVFGG